MSREAWLEPQHVLVGINWPVLSGCMADACAMDQQPSLDPLICERGSITDLCEVTVHRPEGLQGQCQMLCSARTCEVYEQKDNESTSYVSTVRGKPKAGAFEHCLILPSATKAVLRLLSLQQRGIVHIHRLQLAAVPEVSPHQPSSAADSSPSYQHGSQSTSRSQQAEVKAMLQDLMTTGPPGSVTNPADTHQNFMAALAKAALAQDKSKLSHRLFQSTHQQQPLAVQDIAKSSQEVGLAQQRPPPSLIQQLPEMDISEEKREDTQSQPLIQELTIAAATSDRPHEDQQELSVDQDISSQQQLSSRVQALEAASRRMERKIDQILQYCRVMTQSMAPVS
ncbi:TPA: hypothetical protein ACH3X1_012859 [Trebouxia sp. C0004]